MAVPKWVWKFLKLNIFQTWRKKYTKKNNNNKTDDNMKEWRRNNLGNKTYISA
jgi:hypothetical protein